jgi:hypothetical protein
MEQVPWGKIVSDGQHIVEAVLTFLSFPFDKKTKHTLTSSPLRMIVSEDVFFILKKTDTYGPSPKSSKTIFDGHI